MTAALADQLALGFGCAPDGLAIGYLRLADIGVDFEFAEHPIDDYLEMQLAHTGDKRLRSFLVDADSEGGILFGELLERLGEFFLVGFGLGLDCYLDDRLREFDRFEHNRMRRIAERVAGGRVAKADRADVAGVNLGDIRSRLPRVEFSSDEPLSSLPE